MKTFSSPALLRITDFTTEKIDARSIVSVQSIALVLKRKFRVYVRRLLWIRARQGFHDPPRRVSPREKSAEEEERTRGRE